MPIESATYINDLTPANPLGSDPAGQGDDHLRLIKDVLVRTLPNMGGVLGVVRRPDSAQTISATWNKSMLVVTNSATATAVLTLPNQASITSGWSVDIYAAGAAVVIQPQAGASINGSANYTVPFSQMGKVFFETGGVFRALTYPSGNTGAVFPGLTVNGPAALNAGVSISGSVSIAGALFVSGGVAVNGAAGFASTVTISGALSVLGLINAVGGAVAFPATQVPSAGANTLDDYEEGTWTPTLTCATPGNLAITYSGRNGYYTKIGRVVQIQLQFQTTTFTHTTASGDMYVTGLPFNPGVGTAGNIFYDGLQITMGTTFGHLCAFLNAANSVIFYLLSHCAGGNGTILQMNTNHTSGVNHQVRSDVTYIV